MSDLTASSRAFVGRTLELSQLHAALQSAIAESRPKSILIQGDFGVGKTALIEHFLSEIQHHADRQPTPLIGRAKCAMETEGNGLIPFQQLLSALLEESIQHHIIVGNAAELVKETAPAWLDILSLGSANKTLTVEVKTSKSDEADSNDTSNEGSPADRSGGVDIKAKAVHVDGDVVGRDKIVNKINVFQGDRISYTQGQIFVQFANLLRRIAEHQLVVAFVDDLQWADTSSLQLLFHLVRNLEDRAVLIIVAYRPVQAMAVGPNAALFREIQAELVRYGTKEIELRQGIAVAEYVSQRYPQNSLPAELIQRLQVQTEGHALFVNQLFSLWEDTGVIAAVAGPDGSPTWKLMRDSDVSTIAIPPAIGAVLDERISLMEDELREILTCASVEGEDFTAQVVTRLRQLDEIKGFDDLEIIERRYRLVLRQGTQQVAAVILDLYRFAHRFFRERIYQNLSSGKRRILHRQVGEHLEALYNDRRSIAGQLARHFSEANELLKAARYALMAAQFEQLRWAWVEGEAWCEFGLELLNKINAESAEVVQLKLDLMEQSGYGHYKVSTYPRAYARYTEALALAQNLPIAAEHLASIYNMLADIDGYAGRVDEAITQLDRGQQLLVDRSVPFGEMHVELKRCRAYLEDQRGQADLALKLLRETLADADKLPSTSSLMRIKAGIHNMCGIILTKLSRHAEAYGSYQQAIQLARQVHDEEFEATCLLNVADNCLQIGKLEEGQAYIDQGAAIIRRIGDLDKAAYGQYLSGQMYLELGKFTEAISEFSKAIDLSKRLDAVWNMSALFASLATANLAVQNVEAADEQSAAALNYAGTSPYELGEALDVRAQVEAAQSRWDLASQHFNQSIETHQRAGYRQAAAIVQRHHAQALLQRGDRQPAAQLLQTALNTFQELTLQHEVTKTQQLLNAI